MTDPTVHSAVLAAIYDSGGHLVASFELDQDGQTVGLRRDGNRRAHCSACGEPGHIRQRCRGAGNPPKLTHRELRRAGEDWLLAAAQAAGDELAETKAILAARSEQRRDARRKR